MKSVVLDQKENFINFVLFSVFWNHLPEGTTRIRW